MSQLPQKYSQWFENFVLTETWRGLVVVNSKSVGDCRITRLARATAEDSHRCRGDLGDRWNSLLGPVASPKPSTIAAPKTIPPYRVFSHT